MSSQLIIHAIESRQVRHQTSRIIFGVLIAFSSFSMEEANISSSNIILAFPYRNDLRDNIDDGN